MIDHDFPWHVGISPRASQYMTAEREDAERFCAHLNRIDQGGWSVRHEDEIIAAKRKLPITIATAKD